MSKIKKPFELKVQTTIKALIYGQPGLRKTTFGISAPAPLLLDFDNGIHRVDTRFHTDTLQMESWQDVLDMLADDDLTPYKTLVIDTAGKMLDYMGNYLINKNSKLGKANGALTLQGYGERKAEFSNFLKRVSLMGKHLVFLAHEREEKDGEQKIIRPEIGGSSGADLIKELDLVGYMQSIGLKKTISFEPCEKFYGKNTCSLPPTIELINAIEDNKPNNQLGTIFDTYQKMLEERKRIAADYSELLNVIIEKIDAIEDADTANEVSEWASKYESHIWDSRLQAALRINEKAKAIGLTLKNKKYEQPKATV